MAEAPFAIGSRAGDAIIARLKNLRHLEEDLKDLEGAPLLADWVEGCERVYVCVRMASEIPFVILSMRARNTKHLDEENMVPSNKYRWV